MADCKTTYHKTYSQCRLQKVPETLVQYHHPELPPPTHAANVALVAAAPDNPLMARTCRCLPNTWLHCSGAILLQSSCYSSADPATVAFKASAPIDSSSNLLISVCAISFPNAFMPNLGLLWIFSIVSTENFKWRHDIRFCTERIHSTLCRLLLDHLISSLSSSYIDSISSASSLLLNFTSSWCAFCNPVAPAATCQ